MFEEDPNAPTLTEVREMMEEVEAEIAAPALLSGRIEFRKVKLLRPIVSLERLASGGTSWDINPARSLQGLPGADQIAVAGIDFYEGDAFPLWTGKLLVGGIDQRARLGAGPNHQEIAQVRGQ